MERARTIRPRPGDDTAEPGEFAACVQVESEHYGAQYEASTRWVSYGAQVRAVMQCSPESVLEVGTGAGTIAAVLRSRGLAVTTLDIDPALRPDILGSVHELSRYVPPRSFDVVLCAEVLEHLPFELLSLCCDQLGAAARHRVVIGLPCLPRPRWAVSITLRLPRLRGRTFGFGVTRRPRWPGPGREHYWSVDYRPYTMKAVRRVISRFLTITETVRDPLDPCHLLLVCLPQPTATSATR